MMMMAGGGGAAVDHNGIYSNPNLHSLQQPHMEPDNRTPANDRWKLLRRRPAVPSVPTLEPIIMSAKDSAAHTLSDDGKVQALEYKSKIWKSSVSTAGWTQVPLQSDVT
ncbi:hypothetical protein INR49_011411 [Caranx melampygus]|nr:hypothetical protein INR49_011411 [Caranx melampygus]